MEKKRVSVAERVALHAAKKKEEDKEGWLEKGREKRKNYLDRISEQAR